MKIKSNLEKLIVSLLVISAFSGIGISASTTTSKNDSQFSSFGNRIISNHSSDNKINTNKPDKQDSLELKLKSLVNDTDTGLNRKFRATNVSTGSVTINNGSQIVSSFDSRRQGEQIVSSEDAPETDQSNRQDFSTNNPEQYSSEDIDQSMSQKEQPVLATNNSLFYENDTKENDEHSNWYIEKDVADEPANSSDNIQRLANGSNIDTKLIRNLTEGLFPIEHISSVALNKFFPETLAHSNNNVYHPVRKNNSSDQLLKSPADYDENESEFNSTSHENISDFQFPSPISADKQNASNKHQTSHLTSSFYQSKPSKRVERKYSLIDLIGQAGLKANREHGVAQSKMFTSRSRPEVGNFEKLDTTKASQEPSFPSMNNRNINLPIDYITYSETISPRQSLTNRSANFKHDEQQTSASSPLGGGLVEKGNSFEFVQKTPTADENRNMYQKIFYHSTPFRPSNNLSDKNGSSQHVKLLTPQQSRQTSVRSEPLREKPVVSFASPNESDSNGYAKTSNQQIRDNIYRNDPRGTSASTRSETSAIRTTDSKDQTAKTRPKGHFKIDQDNSVIKESPPPPQSPPVTRKEKLMLDLYEREIDQQIAQALYKEMRKSAEILVKSAAAAASASSHISSNMFASAPSPSSASPPQPVAESSYQQALTWPMQSGGSLVSQISESQLNPNQVEIIQMPEMYQGLETISGSDLDTVVLPLMPGYSFNGIASAPVKEVFEPNLSQQHSINLPTFQVFPQINNGFNSQANGENFGTKLTKFKGKKLAMAQQVVASPSVVQQNSIAARPHYAGGLKEAILKMQSSKLSPFLTNSLSYLYSNLPKAIWNYKRPPKEHKQTSRQPALVNDLLPATNSLFFSIFPSSTSSRQSFKNLAPNIHFNTENDGLSNSASFTKPALRHRNLPAVEATLGDLLSSVLENVMLNSQINLPPVASEEPLNLYPNLNSIINPQIILDMINKKSANFANRLGDDEGRGKFTFGIEKLPLAFDKSTNTRSKKDQLSLGIKNTCSSSEPTNAFSSIPFPMVV